MVAQRLILLLWPNKNLLSNDQKNYYYYFLLLLFFTCLLLFFKIYINKKNIKFLTSFGRNTKERIILE